MRTTELKRMTLTTTNAPAELPQPEPDVTIEIAFLPFNPLDPALRAHASVVVQALGLLLTGFHVRQWPGVHQGIVRVDTPPHVQCASLRVRDAIARVYRAAAEERRGRRLAVHCCPGVSLWEKEPPIHTTNCPHHQLQLVSLSPPVWDVDDLSVLAAQMTDTFAAGGRADVCRQLAALPGLEAALVAIRIVAPAPEFAEAAPEVPPPALALLLGGAIEEERRH